MKAKIFTLVIALGCLFSFKTKADEGLWLPLLVERLNYVDMQKMGLHLTADELYSANKACIKDAIVQFGYGCTGSLVSAEGLIMTAHHCGYDQIQANSTVDKDLITNGFWAMNKQEELVCPGLQITFLVRMENVTDRIMKELTETMTESARKNKIKELSSKIETEAIGKTHYNASVKGFFEDNEFYLFVTEVFRDVRLVGAPPQAIGNFGGDTDNWMWPRHSCDFSIFRVYTALDGKPADYSKDNIPYKSKYFLPININGVKDNDFAMIIGYPGKTDRYLSSFGVKLAQDETNPAIIKIRSRKLDILSVEMSRNPDTRIKYAAKYQNSSNYWKFYIGQTKQIKRFNVYAERKKLEADFQKWVLADPKRKEKYGNVLSDFASSYEVKQKYNLYNYYYSEIIKRGCDVTMLAEKFIPLYQKLQSTSGNKEKDLSQIVNALKDKVRQHFKNFNPSTDKKVFISLMQMFYYDISKDQHPAIFSSIEDEYKGDFEKFADDVYAKSMFSNGIDMWAFLSKPSEITLQNDILFKLILSATTNLSKFESNQIEENWKLNKATHLFLVGLQEMKPNLKFYPNANSTLRLSYGKVTNYIPSDGLTAEAFTTIEGVFQKEDANSTEFVVPARLKDLYNAKDYGRYADNGVMKTCFITNNDASGGNSGGPLINGDGHFIGLVFDKNWEGMSGDILYDKQFQRIVNADARYILFIIDKFANAQNIINELKIIQN